MSFQLHKTLFLTKNELNWRHNKAIYYKNKIIKKKGEKK